MQYIMDSLKPGKPYRRRRMTHSNCAINVEKQARLYAAWVNSRPAMDRIHVFPHGPLGNSRRCWDILLRELDNTALRILMVDPADWRAEK